VRPLTDVVRARTALRRPPLVPELVLHLQEDVVALWQDVEADLGRTGTDPPFWGAAWAGGQVLARLVLDGPGLVAGRRVLDLGSGSGLVALAALRAGAGAVVASEVDPLAAAAIALNAAANGLPAPEVVGDVLGGGVPDADVVLAGDVCYDRDMTARVLPWLRAARDAGADVLLGDPGRAYLPREGLAEVVRHDVPVPAMEGRPVLRSTVWRLVPGGVSPRNRTVP
jgi:predicted nicotinamide N-methyase